MKWLKIITVGLLMWAATLLWVEINTMFVSPLMLGIVVGLIAILPTYYLGRYVEQTRGQIRRELKARVNTTSTKPGSATQRFRRYHSNPTLPMPALRPRTLHSQRTRPMSSVS